jgi:hypothetical protein
MALSAQEAKRQRRQLLREIALEHKRKDKEKLVALRTEIRGLKVRRREAMREAVQFCRTGRCEAKKRAKDRVQAIRDAAREAIARARTEEKMQARAACTARKKEIRASSLSATQKARAELREEQRLQREIKRIDSGERKRDRQREASSAERRQESDDEVRQNIPAELVPLFERVKKTIKGSTRQSRTEAFMQYAEENPHEVVDAQEAISQREIARLIREEAALRHAMRTPRRYKPTAAELAAIPF